MYRFTILAPIITPPLFQDSYSSVSPLAPALVGGREQFARREVPSVSKSEPVPFHRCFERGMGSPLRLPGGLRSVGGSNKSETHQLVRTQGSLSSPSAIRDSGVGSPRTAPLRQYDSGSICKQMGGTKSPDLCYLLWDMMFWCKERDITLRARHLPQEVANQVFAHWGTPLLDLFATYHNAKLPMFVAPTPDTRALAMDALSISWEGILAYAYPPIVILPLVLRKVQEEDVVLILIAPLWPNRSWFPWLLSLLVDCPIRLPQRTDLLSQGRSIVHPSPESFRLHAFKLSRNPSFRKDFLLTLPRLSQDRSGQVLSALTTANGNDFVIGVSEGRLIQSISLPETLQTSC